MNFLQRLAKTEVAALVALVIGATLLAVFSALQARLAPDPAINAAGSAGITFVYFIVLGLIPALAFGAPIYAWLWRHGKATWISSLLVGLIPGLALAAFESELGMTAMICGAFVALLTHKLARFGL